MLLFFCASMAQMYSCKPATAPDVGSVVAPDVGAMPTIDVATVETANHQLIAAYCQPLIDSTLAQVDTPFGSSLEALPLIDSTGAQIAARDVLTNIAVSAAEHATAHTEQTTIRAQVAEQVATQRWLPDMGKLVYALGTLLIGGLLTHWRRQGADDPIRGI